MKLVWSSEDIACAVRGRLAGPSGWTAHGVSIDSRSIKPGDLFIAIKGPAKDAHDYVAQALGAGAVAAVIDHDSPNLPSGKPLVYVEDTFAALQDLGRVGRQRASATIVAVTGSVGKTSSKEMLRLILSATGATHANEGSLNNHWGVPLSLARLPADARFGVFEIGMNHAGELGPLSREVHPHVAFITNVEAVHLEHFESVEAIAGAKAEIFLGMDPEGVAVLNRDNPHFARLFAAAQTQGLKRILSFGRDPKSEARLVTLRPDDDGSEIEAVILGRNITFRLGAPGEHAALNALGALLTAAVAGADLNAGLNALASFRPPQGRGVREKIIRPDGSFFSLIDDSYNASPASMRAAIGVLGQTSTDSGSRRVAVLGDMLEMGRSSPHLHAALAQILVESGINVVHCCGALMGHLYDSLPPALRGQHTTTSAELVPYVVSGVRNGDVIMIKGSHSMQMDHLAAALRALSSEPKK